MQLLVVGRADERALRRHERGVDRSGAFVPGVRRGTALQPARGTPCAGDAHPPCARPAGCAHGPSPAPSSRAARCGRTREGSSVEEASCAAIPSRLSRDCRPRPSSPINGRNQRFRAGGLLGCGPTRRLRVEWPLAHTSRRRFPASTSSRGQKHRWLRDATGPAHGGVERLVPVRNWSRASLS